MSINNLWEEYCNKAIKKEENKDELFLIKPVSSEIFFKEWLKPGLSPVQLEAINSIFKLNDKGELEWNDQFQEYLLLWGEGCLSGTTVFKDAKTRKEYTIKELAEQGRTIKVKSMIKESGRLRTTIKRSGVPYKKGTTRLYKVKTKSSKEITVSGKHKFYREDGTWVMLKDLAIGDKIAADIKQKGGFQKGDKPWNTGKHLAKRTIEKIRKTCRRAALKLTREQRRRQAKAQEGMKNHKLNCQCPWCKSRRNGPRTVWYRTKYKGINMRSSWETKYAKYLDSKGIKWLYESKTFKVGSSNYTPDFYLPKTNEYIEIKGWYTTESKNKIKTFVEKYPHIKFKILRRADLEKLGVL